MTHKNAINKYISLSISQGQQAEADPSVDENFQQIMASIERSSLPRKKISNTRRNSGNAQTNLDAIERLPEVQEESLDEGLQLAVGENGQHHQRKDVMDNVALSGAESGISSQPEEGSFGTRSSGSYRSSSRNSSDEVAIAMGNQEDDQDEDEDERDYYADQGAFNDGKYFEKIAEILWLTFASDSNLALLNMRIS